MMRGRLEPEHFKAGSSELCGFQHYSGALKTMSVYMFIDPKKRKA
jgi:hypothetical protein